MLTRKTVIKKKKKRIDKNLHPRRKLRKTFLLAVASSRRLSSGSLDFRLSAIELSERNDRSFRGISTEFPRRSSVHDIPPRRLQVRGQDTVRDGERQASWTIVRQTGIRLARVPRPNRLHRVRFPRATSIDRIFSRDRSFHDVSLSFVLFLFQLAGENRRRWHVSVVDLRKSHDPWIQQSRKFRTVLSSVPKVSEGYERVGSLLE